MNFTPARWTPACRVLSFWHDSERGSTGVRRLGRDRLRLGDGAARLRDAVPRSRSRVRTPGDDAWPRPPRRLRDNPPALDSHPAVGNECHARQDASAAFAPLHLRRLRELRDFILSRTDFAELCAGDNLCGHEHSPAADRKARLLNHRARASVFDCSSRPDRLK